MDTSNLEQLLLEEMQDVYDAEKQLVKAIPELAKAATNPELKDALKEHWEVTKGHVKRLEQAFKALGVKAKSKTCAGMKGLIAEGREVVKENDKGDICDAAIIGGAQRVEHYEIAAYGTIRTLAEKLGKDDVAELFQQTLDEEKEADEKLTEVSESMLATVES